MLFAARSAEEANMWCNHISRAGLSELSARRLQLREEIRHLTGKDPLDPLNPALNSSQPACGRYQVIDLLTPLCVLVICYRVFHNPFFRS